MNRKKPKDTWAFVYGPELEELGGDGSQFVVVEESAALKAVAGFRARTWGEFAAVATISFSELMDSWVPRRKLGRVVRRPRRAAAGGGAPG